MPNPQELIKSSREQRLKARMETLDLCDFRNQSKATRDLNETMFSWLDSFSLGNIKPKKFLCEIADFSNNLRGMRATSHIKAGQKILWFPMPTVYETKNDKASSSSIVINAKTVLDDSVVKRFLSATHPADLEFTMEHLFFIFLIAHKRKRHISRYAAYIRSLPQTYDTPIMWDDHQIKNMPSEDDAKVIFDEIDRVWEIFAIIKESLENACILNDIDFYTDFLWAYNVLKTRGFECRLDDRTRFQITKFQNQSTNSDIVINAKIDLSHVSVNHILCPYMDMVNHSSTLVNADVERDVVTDCWVLYAIKDIRMGEQIFISYGEDSTCNTFITYGFIDNSVRNPFEKVCFTDFDFSNCLSQSTEQAEENGIIVNPEKARNHIINSGLYTPNDPKENLLYINHLQGCSWGMQRAVLLLLVNTPKQLGRKSTDNFEDYLSWELKITSDMKYKANQLLRKIIRKKVIQLKNCVKNLESDQVLFQRGNEMIKILCEMQVEFLCGYLEEHEDLYLLGCGEFGDEGEVDSGNDSIN